MGIIEPLVSIVTITYNHEPFIAKTIEGVLIQKTTFPIEFIIADDFSTDKTRKIIKEYADQHPDLIEVIISDRNVGAIANECRALQKAQGKYIAVCEGDDYWTDPLKLQKQVDFLETHPGYSVCFHRFRNYYVQKNEWQEDNCGQFFIDKSVEGVNITTEMFFKKWITQPLTMVYSKDAFDLDIALQYKHYRDIHQIYHLLQKGKGFLFAFDGGVRTIHNKGMASMSSLLMQCESTLGISRELYKKNQTADTKQYYTDILQWFIYECCGPIKNRRKAFMLTFELFFVQKSPRKFFANLKRIIKIQI